MDNYKFIVTRIAPVEIDKASPHIFGRPPNCVLTYISTG